MVLFSYLNLDLVEAAAATCTLGQELNANNPLPSEGWCLCMCWGRPGALGTPSATRWGMQRK